MKYTVTYDDGENQGAIELEAPERLPQPGDVYEWLRPCNTVGGHHYRTGERMTVVERTGHVPFHRTSSLGNLLVNGPYGTSVWTCFENSVADGWLKLVEKS
jgi:hypothetical protein